MERIAVLQLCLLLLAVPAQYLLGRYMATSPQHRSLAFKRLISAVSRLHTKYLSWQSWKSRLGLCGVSQPAVYGDDLECPAFEVLKYRHPHGAYGTSTEEHSPRPRSVKYRIGQVVRHKVLGYRGVIVGWDAVAKAPENWLKQMYTSDKEHLKNKPNYSVLVDTRDRTSPQRTYVSEESLQIITNVRIHHPQIDEYFEDYDGAQYLLRKWLKLIYPHD